MSYIYLASPYTHEDPEVREQRYLRVLKEAATLIQQGRVVYSPIVHNHPIAELFVLPKNFTFWELYDKVMITACKEVHVLCMEGWMESVGVQAEIKFAQDTGKPVHLRADK